MISFRLLILFLVASHAFGYERALPGYRFEFPRDHFEHRDFRIEWWYYTGNLTTETQRRFGYELTFFRLAIEGETRSETPWDVDQVYLAHFALSDIDGRRFYRQERLNRAGPGLAGASVDQLRVWNGNWSASWLPSSGNSQVQHLQAVSADISLELQLSAAKAAVVHGQDGVSQKSAGDGRASHYISFTRLLTSGQIRIGAETYQVEGSSWMDHEFSTDSMAPEQRGWDWFSVQLADNTELMLYGMRLEDGSYDPFSSGTIVDESGRAVHLDSSEFELTPGRIWSSVATGARYPVEWTLSIPGQGLTLRATPLLDDQEVASEHNLTPTYWEGAVSYEGSRRGEPIDGVGYLEMTGYDRKVRLGR